MKNAGQMVPCETDEEEDAAGSNPSVCLSIVFVVAFVAPFSWIL